MHATRSIYNWWIWWYDCDRRRSSAAAVTVRTATKIYRTHGATMNQHKRYILMSNDAHGTWLMRWTELLWIGLTDRHALREIATSQSCTVHCLINMEMGRHLLHCIFDYAIWVSIESIARWKYDFGPDKWNDLSYANIFILFWQRGPNAHAD